MNTFLLLLIGLPALEILIMIKIGQQVGALSTIALIFLTAIIGIYYARIEGLNTIKSGVMNLYNNKVPVYEMISGAAIAFAAVLLIFPGFLTDVIGFLLIIPITRRILIKKISSRIHKNKKNTSNVVEGDFEEAEQDDNDSKLIK